MGERIVLPRSDDKHKDLATLSASVLSSLAREATAEHRANVAQDAAPSSHVISMRRTDARSMDVTHLDAINPTSASSSSGSGSSWDLTGCTSTVAGEALSNMMLEGPTESRLIVHMSDTHNLLKPHSKKLFFPRGDILIHSGNFTLSGSAEEFERFDAWLKSVQDLYPIRIVVLGSKDVKQFGTQWLKMKSLLPHATHVCVNEQVTVYGIKFYAVGWHPGIKSNGTIRPGAASSTSLGYESIPHGIDVLVTHGPAFGVLDKVGGLKEHWGSRELVEAIRRVEPHVHLHGHIKESRGFVAPFGKSPLVLNSSMTNTDREDCVLYAAPHVILATWVGGSGAEAGHYNFKLSALST